MSPGAELGRPGPTMSGAELGRACTFDVMPTFPPDPDRTIGRNDTPEDDGPADKLQVGRNDTPEEHHPSQEADPDPANNENQGGPDTGTDGDADTGTDGDAGDDGQAEPDA